MITPIGSGKALLKKMPNNGNKPRFSNGKAVVEIILWEVWNSRVKSTAMHYSKINSEEISAVFRTHDKLADELEPQDMIVFKGSEYYVKKINEITTAMSVQSKDYEISVE